MRKRFIAAALLGLLPSAAGAQPAPPPDQPRAAAAVKKAGLPQEAAKPAEARTGGVHAPAELLPPVPPPRQLDLRIGDTFPMTTPPLISVSPRGGEAKAAATGKDAAPPGGIHDPRSAAPTQQTAGCSAGGDITELLSPACLRALRAMRVPDGGGAVLPPGPDGIGGTSMVQEPHIQCTVAIFGPGGSSQPSSFPEPTLQACIRTGAGLSYGIAGVTNITAEIPGYGVVAVSCRRPPPDGREISCAAQ